MKNSCVNFSLLYRTKNYSLPSSSVRYRSRSVHFWSAYKRTRFLFFFFFSFFDAVAQAAAHLISFVAIVFRDGVVNASGEQLTIQYCCLRAPRVHTPAGTAPETDREIVYTFWRRTFGSRGETEQKSRRRS